MLGPIFAVKHHSIANLDGKFDWLFDWLKEEIADQPYAKRIAWRESDNGDYDVRDLICVLEAMNVIDFPNDSGTHPISAYEGRERVTRKFFDDSDAHESDPENSTYRKLRPIMKEALVLYDTIRRDFRKIYNENKLGTAGSLDIVERARKGHSYDFPFAQLPDEESRLTKGALYPIFAAFRNKVFINPDTGLAEWDGGFQSVLELWKQSRRALNLLSRLRQQQKTTDANQMFLENHVAIGIMYTRRLKYTFCGH